MVQVYHGSNGWNTIKCPLRLSLNHIEMYLSISHLINILIITHPPAQRKLIKCHFLLDNFGEHFGRSSLPKPSRRVREARR